MCHQFVILQLFFPPFFFSPLSRIFVGNPGDYAWGREGFDAIVTQLLNQIESTGPPPLTKEKIQEIPVVSITQEQVGM